MLAHNIITVIKLRRYSIKIGNQRRLNARANAASKQSQFKEVLQRLQQALTISKQMQQSN
ncbi:hypothetical protein I8748_09625 [Nostoc sp. CENA67]|uniref:Uncharacterized protein n=1 Tax=Amazonocrinis nigriterrae CENA67 TaxID=2794033 RepID=A0A8J7L6L8_9NOST|nr:hypothetical protein [Amazonocrinis nigriterrae]MBH8562429.1 hypothetical protein [Amazonocrinis nigriterrae CENA67]